MLEEPLNASLSHSSSSQSKMSPPSSLNLHTTQWATDKGTDKVSTHTNGQDLSREKLTMRPLGSMSISSLLGRDDAPPTPQSRSSNPEYRQSSIFAKSSSTDYAPPYLPNTFSSVTRPDNVQNRRPRTPDGVKHSLAVSSKRKQPQSATSPTAANANGRASPWNTARSSGPTRQSYSPLTPNASYHPNLSRENRIETHRTEAPSSMRPIREPVQSPSPFNEKGGRAHSIYRRMNQEHASLAGQHSKNESGQKLYGRVGNGLNSSDDQRYEAQSLEMNQGRGMDYWIATERTNDENLNVAAKNEFYEKNVSMLRDQAAYNVLNTKSVGHGNGDYKGSLKRERSSTDSQNDSNDFFRRSEAPWLSASSARGNQRSRNMFSEGASRRLEELPHHKVLAGITSENNKKTGRASPLPQAVQGAQAQPAGPGGNPGIKNEFGRMFSGLGSGLSSAPPNNGVTSPRLSPLPQRPHDGVESAPPHSNVNLESLKLTRTGSYPGGKIRRMKEDDSFPNGSVDGRSSPLAALEQGLKRNKQTHTSHHHHHPPLGHQ